MSWLRQYLCGSDEYRPVSLKERDYYRPRIVHGARKPWNFDKDGKPEFRDLTKIYKHRTIETMRDGIVNVKFDESTVCVAEDHPVLELVDMVRTATGQKLPETSDQFRRGWYCFEKKQIDLLVSELEEHWKDCKNKSEESGNARMFQVESFITG